MSYATYLPNSYQNDSKICINGVELINRHELSSTQDKELQRFIDNNAHIIQWQERELPPPPPPRKTPSHKYEEMRRSLSRGPGNLERYSSMDKLFTKQNKNVEAEQGINPKDLPICPNIDNHNYTNEFPGLEYLSDNKFIEDLIKSGHVSLGNSGLISQPGSRVGSAMSASYSQPQSATSTLTRQSHTQPHQQPQQQQQQQYAPQHPNNTNYYTTTSTTTTSNYHPSSASQYGGSQSQYGSLSNVGSGSNYGTLKGGMKHTSTLPPTSPYSSLKRKGVSWLDQERARSLSPGLHQYNLTTRQVQQPYNRPASTIHTTTYTTTY
ncbi:unnamed protein product [Caenorhabditis sp. 36 PRJEB53466]|nr:unnamed protein product [Caenorhabditis sp. 36 PRJEB53466]